MSDISGKIGSLDDLNDDNHLDLVKNEIAEIASNEEVVFDDYEENDFDEASASSLDDLVDDNADQFPLHDFDQQQGGSGAKKGFFASLFRQPEEPLNSLDVDSVAYNDEFNASDLKIISDYSNESDFSTNLTETESNSFIEESIEIKGGVGSKIVTALIGLIIFTLAATSFTTVLQVRRGLAATIAQNSLVQAEILSDLLVAFFVEEINPLQSLAISDRMHHGAEDHSNNYFDADGNLLSSEAILARIEALDVKWRAAPDNDPLIVNTITDDLNPVAEALLHFQEAFPEHVEIFATDVYGATIGSTNRLSDYYQADEGWWQAAWNNGKGAVYISDPEVDESSGTTSLLIALPIRADEDSGLGNAIVGILRSTLELGVLAAHVSDPQVGKSGYAVLMDGQGNTIVDPGLARGDNSNELIFSVKQAVATQLSGSQVSIDEKGEGTIFSYAKLVDPVELTNDDSIKAGILTALNKLDWSIVTRQSSSEAFAIINQIVTWVAGVGLFAILIALLVAVNISKGITSPIRQLASLSNRVANGDLSKLANIHTSDEVGYLAQSFNTAIQRLRGIVTTEEERDREREQREELQANVGDFLDVAMDIANGDLTQRGKVSEDVLGNVIDAINLMVEEVAYLLQDVQIAALSVNSGSQEMIQTTEAITQSTLQQSQEAQQATQEVAEVTKSIREMAENAQTSAEASQQAFLASEQGQEAVTNTLGGMQNIRREVQSISKRIKSLGDRSLEISEIVDTISGITRQTNLLALNAAIEASGAGEAGRRFAIVADEVRKLADDSAKATERIAGLIKNVQAEVQEVVISVEDGTREVETGYRVATEAGQRLKEIGDISQRSAQLAQLISQATQAQVAGVEQVGNKVTSIAGIAETSQTNVEQGRDVAQNLQELAEKLAQSLERFRIA